MSDHNDIPGKVIPNHDYDGIEELDNPLPRWWLQIFWGTIIFSIGYYGYYELGGGPTLQDELATDKKNVEAVHAELKTKVEGSLDFSALASDSSAAASGKQAYITHCSACHLQDGGGSIGPNLTDNAWMHGDGGIESIYKVIAEGVVAKGMPAWEKVLTPNDLRNVTAFVNSLKGTTPATPKAPQGTVY